MKDQNPLFDERVLRIAGLVIRAANHKLRIRICQLVEENGELSALQISAIMGEKSEVISQHLAILRRVGIVQTERRGSTVFYGLDHFRILAIHEAAKQLDPHR